MRVIIGAGVLAVLAGCGSATAGPHGNPSGSGVAVSGSPGTPGPSLPAGSVTVTEADNGGTVRLHVGQSLRVLLGGSGEQWRRPTSAGHAVRLTAAAGGYPSGRPADAVFAAVRDGTASVTSVTDYPCLHTQPACLRAQRVWTIHITVTRAG